jgi:hypothetical protein
MSSVVTQIMAEANHPSGFSLGTILDVENGQGLTLLSKGRRIPIYAHGFHVNYLYRGDEVLFADLDGGAYVVARSRKPGELPQRGFNEEGKSLNLSRETESLTLNTKNATLSITEVGTIELQTTNARVVMDTEGNIFVSGETRENFTDLQNMDPMIN